VTSAVLAANLGFKPVPVAANCFKALSFGVATAPIESSEARFASDDSVPDYLIATRL
jgi:hypothetical protein